MPSAIAVTTKSARIAGLFVRPSIFVNGHGFAGTWGRNVIPVPPGWHQLHIHLGNRLLGPADLTVPVQPGQTVELEYAGPAWSMFPGSLGPAPQRHYGMSYIITCWVIVLAVGVPVFAWAFYQSLTAAS